MSYGVRDSGNGWKPAAPFVVRERLRVRVGINLGPVPCGKCGCEFVKVSATIVWPINTVALLCFKCGSCVEYIDGLAMVSIKQYLRDYVTKSWKAGATASVVKERSWGLLRELVAMGVDHGLTKQDISEALEVSEEYVELLGGARGGD